MFTWGCGDEESEVGPDYSTVGISPVIYGLHTGYEALRMHGSRTSKKPILTRHIFGSWLCGWGIPCHQERTEKMRTWLTINHWFWWFGTWILFSISYMGQAQPHWRTHIFQDGSNMLKPPTSNEPWKFGGFVYHSSMENHRKNRRNCVKTDLVTSSIRLFWMTPPGSKVCHEHVDVQRTLASWDLI